MPRNPLSPWESSVTDAPQAMRQTIDSTGRGPRRPPREVPTVDAERPKPSTVALVREALDHCDLDPRGTPRSNQARLLFAVYYCAGLPFPYGWREACVAELAAQGVPATTVELDLVHTAMCSDAAGDFLDWPGIDPVLVRDLVDRASSYGDGADRGFASGAADRILRARTRTTEDT